MGGCGVYVLELKKRRIAESLCSLYVGSSWFAPSERQRQHHDGYRTGSASFPNNTRRLRPELFLDLRWVEDRREAVELERRRARRLSEAGFDVQCDGSRFFSPPGTWRPFSEDELLKVDACFRDLLRGLLSTALRPLTVDEAARLLRWRPGEPSVAELVTTPNDFLGRFAHADAAAVRARTKAAQSISPRLIGS